MIEDGVHVNHHRSGHHISGHDCDADSLDDDSNEVHFKPAVVSGVQKASKGHSPQQQSLQRSHSGMT